MIYLGILILLVYLIYRYDYRRYTEGKLFWMIVVTLIFIVLGGLHYRVGFDSLGYERYFRDLKPLNLLTYKYIESQHFAPGFVILSSFTKLFSEEPVLLYFIQSGFICIVATWFFFKNTQRIFFALLMFYFFLFTLLLFEQIREAMAVGFFLLAWPAFRSNKWWLYYIFSFCAILFHTSASFMFILPIILLPGINQLFIFGRRTWVFCAIVLGAALVLRVTFSQYIHFMAITQSMEELTSKYEDTDYVKGNLNFFGMFAVFVRDIFYPVLALIYFNRVKRWKEGSRDFRRMEMMVMMSIYISLMTIGVPIITRFNNYFFFFPIVLISDWVFQYLVMKKRKVRLSFAYWVLLLLPMFGMQVYSRYANKINKSGTYKTYMAYYPYTSYLDKEKNQQRLIVIRNSNKKKR